MPPFAAGAQPDRSRGRRRAVVAQRCDRRESRRAGARPHRGRDTRKSSRSRGAAESDEPGRARRRFRHYQRQRRCQVSWTTTTCGASEQCRSRLNDSCCSRRPIPPAMQPRSGVRLKHLASDVMRQHSPRRSNCSRSTPSVRFRHPLVRSASYAAATAEDRRAAHLALGAAAEAASDQERRVWHRAAAAAGPDEAVALELEGTAETARHRAGLAAAAAFLQRAVELTAEPSRLANRALAAAQANLQAGAFDTARSLLAEAGGAAVNDLQRAQVEQLNGQVQWASNPGRTAPLLLLQAAKRLETLDVQRARETYLDAWIAALVAGRLAEPAGDLLEVSRTAQSVAAPVGEPRPVDLFLDGFATMVCDGRAAAAPVFGVPSIRSSQIRSLPRTGFSGPTSPHPPPPCSGTSTLGCC